MGFHLMGRAEDICTLCTPALLTVHPTPTHTLPHTLPITSEPPPAHAPLLNAPAALQSHLPDAYI